MADTKISALTAATFWANGDVLPMVQSGVTKKFDPSGKTIGLGGAPTLMITDGNTNTINPGLLIEHDSTGIVAAGFGNGIELALEDAGALQGVTAGGIYVSWTSPTHNAAVSRLDLRAATGSIAATRASVFGSGGFAVNHTTDPGAGIISANTGFWVGTAASTSGKIMQSDGAAFKASTPTWPTTAGTAGNFVRSDGTNMVSQPFCGVTTLTAAVTVTTTTTETVVMTYTVPANQATAGTTYRVTAWGSCDNGTTACTYTPRIRWGGVAGVVLIATPTIVGTTTSQTAKAFFLEGFVTVRTTGSTGTHVTNMTLENHTASTTGVWARDCAFATANTIDTTAQKDLVLTWQMSTTTGSPLVRTEGGMIEIVHL